MNSNFGSFVFGEGEELRGGVDEHFGNQMDCAGLITEQSAETTSSRN